MSTAPQIPSADSASKRADAIFLALLVAGAFLLRLPNLGESLWWDETCYTFMELSAGSIDRLLFHDVHPPLYTLILWVWVRIFGDGTITVRVPSLIFGLVSLIVLFSLTRNWFGKKTAMLAALLMTVSPVHIWYSQENKNNMLLLLLTLLTVYTLDRAWRSNRGRDWVWFCFAVMAAIWTNHFAVWIATAAFLWLWLQVLRPGGRSRFKTVLACSIAAASAFAPFALQILFGLKVESWTYLKAFTPADLYNLFLVYLSHGNTLRSLFPWAPLNQVLVQPWYLFAVDLFYLGLFVIGLKRVLPVTWQSFRDRIGPLDQTAIGYSLLPLYLFIPPLLLMTASLWKHIYIERSMIIVLPAFVMALSVGVRSINHPAWRKGVIAVLAAFSIIALYNLWWAKSDQWTVWMPNPDWRAAANYFADQQDRFNDRIMVVGATPSRALNYYFSRRSDGISEKRASVSGPSLPLVEWKRIKGTGLFQFLFENHIETVYILHNLNWTGAFPIIIQSAQRDRKFLFEEKTAFKGLDIYKYSLLATKPDTEPGS